MVLEIKKTFEVVKQAIYYTISDLGSIIVSPIPHILFLESKINSSLELRSDETFLKAFSHFLYLSYQVIALRLVRIFDSGRQTVNNERVCWESLASPNRRKNRFNKSSEVHWYWVIRLLPKQFPNLRRVLERQCFRVCMDSAKQD